MSQMLNVELQHERWVHNISIQYLRMRNFTGYEQFKTLFILSWVQVLEIAWNKILVKFLASQDQNTETMRKEKVQDIKKGWHCSKPNTEY